jgi:hypothetical protein
VGTASAATPVIGLKHAANITISISAAAPRGLR